MNIEISTDPNRLDLDVIHRFLSERSYWARGRPMEMVVRTIDNSLCFGAYLENKQVGFARVVTDRITFAWLGDVFILEEYQGQGHGKAFIAAILDHPDLREVRRWLLATKDAHGLYAQYGFTPVPPERFMERRNPNIERPSGD